MLELLLSWQGFVAAALSHWLQGDVGGHFPVFTQGHGGLRSLFFEMSYFANADIFCDF